MSEFQNVERTPYDYPRGLDRPAFEFDGKRLYIEDGLADRMRGAVSPVATWGSETSALIDGRAFDLLRKACDGNRERLENYLRAITDFEIYHSGDEARHRQRTPVEQEILDALKREGYFG